MTKREQIIEILKYAVIGSESYSKRIEQTADAILALDEQSGPKLQNALNKLKVEQKEKLQAELIEAQTILINFISIWGKFADLLQTDKLSAKFISRQFDKIGPLKKKLTELEQSISQLQEEEDDLKDELMEGIMF